MRMCQLAREKAPSLDIRIDSCSELTIIEDNSIDLVISNYVLMDTPDQKQVDYHWDFPYFQQRKCIARPWSHFTTEFIWLHRPLSDYWRAFTTAGFVVEAFDEPRMSVASTPRDIPGDWSIFSSTCVCQVF